MTKCSECKHILETDIFRPVCKKHAEQKSYTEVFIGVTCSSFKPKEELILTFGDLYNAWQNGERGDKLYKNSKGELLDFDSEGIYWNQSGDILKMYFGDMNENYTKYEEIKEADLIGALKMHKEGTADRFRLKGTIYWACNPVSIASKGSSSRTHTDVFECKKYK